MSLKSNTLFLPAENTDGASFQDLKQKINQMKFFFPGEDFLIF